MYSYVHGVVKTNPRYAQTDSIKNNPLHQQLQ